MATLVSTEVRDFQRDFGRDFQEAFASVVAIAQSARSATSGWRAICVRERRRLGGPLIASLAGLDLDADAENVGAAVRALVRRSSGDVDTLVFGLFDTIHDGTAVYAGYHVAGVASRGRAASDFMHDPWTPERRHLRSDVLDAILLATPRTRRHLRPVVEYLLFFGAALLTSRFAVGLSPYRIVVGFDDDHETLPAGSPRFVELVAPPSREPLAGASEARRDAFALIAGQEILRRSEDRGDPVAG